MRFLSVCSGIGCADLAFTRLGWEAAAMSEIEAFPRAVLAHRFPGIPVHGDFTTIQGDTYGPVDLLVGGTPCQSFSVAGLRRGMEDARGNLALEYLRLADRLRAKWLVWENVPGVLSSAGGRDFGAFLGGLGELGYGFAYRVLDAQHFGVAQRRRRVFVVGYLGDWRRAAAVLLEPASLRGHPAPRREAGEGVAGSLVGRPDRGGTNSEGSDGHLIARYLTAHPSRSDGETENFVTHTLRGEGFDASEDGTGRGTPLVPVCFSSEMSEPSWGIDLAETLKTTCAPAICFDLAQITSAANRTRVEPGLPSSTLAKQSRMHVAAPVAFTCSEQSNSFAWERDVYPTINAQVPNDTSNIQQGIRLGSAVRRLTPRECERLQGLPDDHTLIPYRGGMAADAPRYKAIGNGMAVPCLSWIGRRIAMVDAQRALEVAA